MSRKVDPWIRRFEVSDPCFHSKGYTIYKITSTVFPRNSPEAATEVVVWKRFSEIKRLHKALKLYHTNLHLKGEFPAFPKDKLFGRFEPSVIEERRQSALMLLEFVALSASLFTSQTFVNFFETSQQTTICQEHVDQNHLIQPVKLCEQDDTPSLLYEESVLSGVWQYRQAEDDKSLDSNDESDDTEPSKELGSAGDINSSLLNIDIGNFDPLSRAQLDSTLTNESKNISNTWLLSAFATSSNAEENEVKTSDSLLFPQAFADYEELEISSAEEGTVKHDVQSLPFQQEVLANELFPVKEKNNFKTELNIVEESIDYNVVANQLLSSARRYESKGDFRTAFDVYKRVIETLLNGLKLANDPLKCSTYRSDIEKYLSHTEKIYEDHLSNKNSSEDIRSVYYSHNSDLSNPRKQLSRYKVLGIICKVLLVQDTITDCTHVIKVVSKSVRSSNCNLKLYFSQQVNHMVRLVRYHETEDSIFLVLQYANGGRLWNFVSSYLQSVAPQLNNDIATYNQDGFSNVYIGKMFTGKLEEITKSGTNLQVISAATHDETLQDRINLKSSENTPVCLDDFNRVTYINQNQKSSMQNLDYNISVQQKKEQFCDKLSAAENYDDSYSRTDLYIETSELVSNAQKLMDTVEETLRASNQVAKSYDDNAVSSQQNVSSPIKSSTHQVISTTIAKDGSSTHPRGRKSSINDPFTMERSSSLIRQPSGSVELQPNKVRHFASIFQQMDDNNSQTPTLPESYVRVWATEIITCVSSLHKLGIICKDLKPDNVLLDNEGHIYLTYFSKWSTMSNEFDQFAKENLYSAPEVGGIEPLSSSCDWWSVGALLFELLTGKTLVSYHLGGFNSHTLLNIPTKISNEAESLLKGFLCYNPHERLGSGPMGIDNIKTHPFFLDFAWN